MNRKFAMSQVFSLLIGMALLLAANAYHPAIAASLRCPTPDIGVLWTPTPTIPPVHAPPPVHVPEARRINELWLDFGGTPDGSDGPFGCPIGYADEAADPGTIWTGVKQRFQRGWIIIGRENLAGFEVAAVRGLNGWTEPSCVPAKRLLMTYFRRPRLRRPGRGAGMSFSPPLAVSSLSGSALMVARFA